MSGHLVRAVDAFYTSLDPLMLGELVDCNDGLEAILSLEQGARLSHAARCAQKTPEDVA
jgi:Rrf2 family nitric oxide-sensitive transcriptional repressor